MCSSIPMKVVFRYSRILWYFQHEHDTDGVLWLFWNVTFFTSDQSADYRWKICLIRRVKTESLDKMHWCKSSWNCSQKISVKAFEYAYLHLWKWLLKKLTKLHDFFTLTCPCPRDMDRKFLEYPILLANIIKAAMGSAPGDSMNIRGQRQLESS